VVVNENIPGRRRFLRREAIAINQFRKAIVVHRQVPRTDANARILPAFRNRLCADGLPASPERMPEFLPSLKLRLFSPANPETARPPRSTLFEGAFFMWRTGGCLCSSGAASRASGRAKKESPQGCARRGLSVRGGWGEGGCRPRTSHQCEMSPLRSYQ
jgi:hypothetical protein